MPKLDTLLTQDKIFHAPHLPENHRSHKLLDMALDSLTVSKPSTDLPAYLWPAERFRLHRSQLWNGLTQEQQTTALVLLSQRNLASSWWIENAGRNYGAKMVLLSESHEEKSLYALFTAEEAIHMREFENFMDFKLDWELHSHPMHKPLAQVIETGERDTLVLVVQVLLEGFGLAHYQGLKLDCHYAPLAQAYDRILKDEARHHGTGVIFAQEMRPSNHNFDHMFEFSRAFINAFMDVSWIQDAIERTRGPLSSQELTRLHEDLSTQIVTTERRQRFKEMLSKVDRIGLVTRLEKDGVF